MIVNLKKFLIYGSKSDMDRFFYLAQKAGFLEFIGLSHKRALELPEHAKLFFSAIKIAKQHFIHPKEAPHLEPLKIAEDILSLAKAQELLTEEKRLLTAEIARVSIFGDFSQDDLDTIAKEGNRVVQFFCMKSDLAREISLPPEVIFVGTEYDLDYFAAINKEKTQYPKMIEMVIQRPVGPLKERLLAVREELARIDTDLRTFCNALPALQKGLTESLNEHSLKLAKHDASSLLGDGLFAIEAWVPENRSHGLHALLRELDVMCEEVTIDSHDRIPTCIENRKMARIGEDLIHIYDVPSHTDKDPSVWVLFFFSLFFAMIISDAGYGVIFLILGLILKWKLPADAPSIAKRFSKLFLILSTCTIAWGIATASFFGIEIGPDSAFRKTSFIHYLAMRKAEYHMNMQDDVYQAYLHDFPSVASAKDGHDFLVKTQYLKEGKVKYKGLEDFYLNLLLELSLIVGILHLSLSFLRYLWRNPVGLGWILFMIGGYLYFPVYLGATSIANILGIAPKPIAAMVGLQLLGLGPALVLIISLFQGKKWMALHELTNGIQVFSDILSYLRLYALALAGMVMADTVNTTLGIEMGIFGTIVIILIGHVINIGMSMMSATIHGLRLNFLEWYRYSFEGGGRLFNPLRIRKS